MDWSLSNRSNGGASPSATPLLTTSATAGSSQPTTAILFQAPAAARQRSAAGLDWLYPSATTDGLCAGQKLRKSTDKAMLGTKTKVAAGALVAGGLSVGTAFAAIPGVPGEAQGVLESTDGTD